MKKTILILLIVMVGLVSCKKYDAGKGGIFFGHERAVHHGIIYFLKHYS